jgi:hypothetical protein
LSTKEGYGLGANDSDPTVGTTCIIVAAKNAVCTMSSAAMDLPFLAASPHVLGEQASQGLNLQARADEGRIVPSALLSTLIWVGTEVCAFPRPWQMEFGPLRLHSYTTTACCSRCDPLSLPLLNPPPAEPGSLGFTMFWDHRRRPLCPQTCL